ncbi:MAG: hypothetical protein HC830_07990 [Bacteroidetes bacterium]|nr:hypothetical protein [Bacteroidales bacterium]NJO69216.1 hypothetical protein [Bacteroidota bacterium]
MKNLTFFLLLMFSSSVFSQHSKVYVYVNIDSASIILDEINQGVAQKCLPMILDVKKGKHEIIAQKRSDILVKHSFSIEKKIASNCFSHSGQISSNLNQRKRIKNQLSS